MQVKQKQRRIKHQQRDSWNIDAKCTLHWIVFVWRLDIARTRVLIRFYDNKSSACL